MEAEALRRMDEADAFDAVDPVFDPVIPYEQTIVEKDIDELLVTSGFRINDTDMDVSEIKRAQTKLVRDIGDLNVHLAKVSKELSEVDFIIGVHRGRKTIEVGTIESNKPGQTSQKPGRAFSNVEKEFLVEQRIREEVEITSPGYDVIADRLRLQTLFNRIESTLKNIDKQGILLSSMAKIGVEQERFGQHG